MKAEAEATAFAEKAEEETVVAAFCKECWGRGRCRCNSFLKEAK